MVNAKTISRWISFISGSEVKARKKIRRKGVKREWINVPIPPSVFASEKYLREQWIEERIYDTSGYLSKGLMGEWSLFVILSPSDRSYQLSPLHHLNIPRRFSRVDSSNNQKEYRHLPKNINSLWMCWSRQSID